MYGIHLKVSEDSDKPRAQQLPYSDSAATAEPLMSQNHQGLQILQPGIARHSWRFTPAAGFPTAHPACLGFRSPWRPAHPAPLCPTCVGGQDGFMQRHATPFFRRMPASPEVWEQLRVLPVLQIASRRNSTGVAYTILHCISFGNLNVNHNSWWKKFFFSGPKCCGHQVASMSSKGAALAGVHS